MGNTTFFRNAKHDVNKITWKEIFSESFKKHKKSDFDKAIATGTRFNTATEADMLSKWEKPWLWFQALKIGAVILALVYGSYFILGGTLTNGMMMLIISVPPAVIPIILLIFIWELNMPKNISIRECLWWVLLGGILSLSFNLVAQMTYGLIIETPIINIWGTLIGAQYIEQINASIAPFYEEPAKLFASIVIILTVRKKKKLYGITGLVIGASVGAGFAIFESIGYAMNSLLSGGMTNAITTQFVRNIWSPGGHIVFCAPYIAATIYHMKNGKLSLDCFANKDFVLTYIAANILHMCWNTVFGFESTAVIELIKNIAVVVALWFVLLYMLKKCLKQLVLIGNYSHTEHIRQFGTGYIVSHEAGYLIHKELMLSCVSGKLKGAAWKTGTGGSVTVGRSSSNTIALRDSAISREHCVIRNTASGWTVQDLISTHGTYLNQKRLAPGKTYQLHEGDSISVATNTIKVFTV